MVDRECQVKLEFQSSSRKFSCREFGLTFHVYIQLTNDKTCIMFWDTVYSSIFLVLSQGDNRKSLLKKALSV